MMMKFFYLNRHRSEINQHRIHDWLCCFLFSFTTISFHHQFCSFLTTSHKVAVLFFALSPKSAKFPDGFSHLMILFCPRDRGMKFDKLSLSYFRLIWVFLRQRF